MKQIVTGALLLTAMAAGCAGQGMDDDEAERLKAREACLLKAQNSASLASEVSDRLTASLQVDRNAPIIDDLQVFEARFEDLRRELELVAARRCDEPLEMEIDFEQHTWQAACLDKAPEVMRTMRDALKRQVDLDLDTLVWALESGLLGLEHALTCDAAAAAAAARQPVALTVHLVCEKKRPSGFVSLPACSEEELVEGDRVRFGFSVDKDAYIYILNYNTKGQFQMLFPGDKQTPNEVKAGDEIFLPGGNEAFTLDNIANVIERMQIVASAERIETLEQIRGLDIPVGRHGRLPQVINVIRGDLEVGAQRWLFQKGEAVQIRVGDKMFETVPMTASAPGLAVVEFPIRHGDPPKKPEPKKVEPIATTPQKTEPVKTEPQKTEPAKTEPAKTIVKVSDYREAILKEKPWAYFTFDGGPDEKRGPVDLGKQLNLSWEGSHKLRPTAIRGDEGKALRFDDGAYAVAKDVTLPRKSITVEFWVKSERKPDFEETPFSYAVGEGDKSNEFLIHDLNELRIYVMGDEIKTKERIADGEWHHVVVTWKSSTGRLRVYKDGKRIWSSRVKKGKSLTRGGTLVIGQEQDCVGGCFKDTQGLFGDIDELAIYDTVLSAPTIARHHKAGR